MNAVPQQRLSAVLSQVATVVSLSSSSLGLWRLDKQASVRSDMAHNARNGTGKTSASRLSGAEHRVKAIADKAAEARAVLHGITTAYDEQRLLANSLMHSWLSSWRPIKVEHTRLVDEFIADAPALLAEAEQNKGSYNVELPTLEEIKSAFRLDYTMKQIPDSSTYKGAGMPDEINREMQRRFEASIQAAYQEATKDAMQRLADPLDKLAAAMRRFDERVANKANGIEDKGGMFRDTIIGNVQEIGKVFGSFNLTNDPFMKAIADKLDAFEGIEANDLRESDQLRKHMADKADEILAGLRDLI